MMVMLAGDTRRAHHYSRFADADRPRRARGEQSDHPKSQGRAPRPLSREVWSRGCVAAVVALQNASRPCCYLDTQHNVVPLEP